MRDEALECSSGGGISSRPEAELPPYRTPESCTSALEPGCTRRVPAWLRSAYGVGQRGRSEANRRMYSLVLVLGSVPWPFCFRSAAGARTCFEGRSQRRSHRGSSSDGTQLRPRPLPRQLQPAGARRRQRRRTPETRPPACPPRRRMAPCHLRLWGKLGSPVRRCRSSLSSQPSCLHHPTAAESRARRARRGSSSSDWFPPIMHVN